MKKAPSSNGPSNGDGRGPGGRFAKGWKGGPGNPFAADVGRHRARFYAALRDDDVDKAVNVIRTLMDDGTAKPADRLAAARELLDRVLGKAVQADLQERIEAIEAALARRAAPGAHENGSNHHDD